MAAGNTYEPIATTTVSGSSTNTITFTSITATYTDLILVLNGTGSVNAQDINLYLNNDSATNYSRTYIYGDGTTAVSGRESNKSFISVSTGDTSSVTTTIQLMNYANTTTYKTVLVRCSSAARIVFSVVGLWRATPAAINRLDIVMSGGTPYFVSGYTATLYGIKAA